MLRRGMIGSILAMAVAVLLCMGTTAWAGGGDYGAPGFEVSSIDMSVAVLGDTYAMNKGNTILGDPTTPAPIASRIPEVTKPVIEVVTGPGFTLKCPCHNGSVFSYGDDNGYDTYGADSGALVMNRMFVKEAALSGFGNPGPQTGHLS